MGERRWRVRHIPVRPVPGTLAGDVMVAAGERFHVDTLDLYAARARTAYCRGGGHGAAGRPPSRSPPSWVGCCLATEEAQAAALVRPRRRGGASRPAKSASVRWRCSSRRTCWTRWPGPFGPWGWWANETGPWSPGSPLTSRLVGPPARRRRPVVVVGRQVHSGRRRLVPHARRGDGQLLGHDRPGPLLPGRDGPRPQGAGHRRGRRGRHGPPTRSKLLVSEGRLAIAAAGKDPVDRAPHHPHLRGDRPGRPAHDDHGGRARRGAGQPPAGGGRHEGRAQTRAVQAAQRQAETLEGLVARAEREACGPCTTAPNGCWPRSRW